MVAPLPVDHEHVWIMLSLSFLLFFFNSAAWILSQAIDWLLCKILCLHFKAFNGEFRKKCRRNGRFMGNLGGERLKHQKLCKLVNYMDNIISPYKASSFGCNISIAIFMTFTIISIPDIAESLEILLMFITWLATALLFLLLSCISGARVNAAVSILYT